MNYIEKSILTLMTLVAVLGCSGKNNPQNNDGGPLSARIVSADISDIRELALALPALTTKSVTRAGEEIFLSAPLWKVNADGSYEELSYTFEISGGSQEKEDGIRANARLLMEDLHPIGDKCLHKYQLV